MQLRASYLMPLRILFGTDQTLGLPVTSSTAVTATPNNHITYFQPNVGVNAAGRVAVSAFVLADGRVMRSCSSGGRRVPQYPAGLTTSSPRAESTKIMPSIRILICDLDGVIRHFVPHA